MSLTAGIDRPRFTDQDVRLFPMGAAATIYRGGLVGLHPATRLAKAFEGGDIFAGIAFEDMSNASGAASAKSVRAYTQGDFVLPLASVVAADAHKAVYGIADDTLSLMGHPDGFVGRVLGVHSSGKAVVRLRNSGEQPHRADVGSLNHVFHAGGVGVTGAVAANMGMGDWQAYSILGLGATIDAAMGGVSLAFDAVAEVAQASIETPVIFSITKGITLELWLNAEAIGDDVALDMDWGIANVLNATTRADLDDATLTRHARFHMDGASANINFESDDNTTDVAAADTTLDNETTAGEYKRYLLVARPSGLVETWANAARLLSSTTFSVGSTAGVFGGFVNLEKTSNDTVAEIVARFGRMAGGRAAISGNQSI